MSQAPADDGLERSRSDRVSPQELEVLLRVRDSLRSIRFGTVLIVVQDGTVVQIETAEKIRLR
ncbi:MAG TPA: YezD family protein [Actinomycetota bacterium]|nr:YezD family protein [Actinomycetota bacterium]